MPRLRPLRLVLAAAGAACAACLALLLAMPYEVKRASRPAPVVAPLLEPAVSTALPRHSRGIVVAVQGAEWIRERQSVDVLFSRVVKETGVRQAGVLLRDVIALPVDDLEAPSRVIFLVGSEEAQMLALAGAAGTLSLALRPSETTDAPDYGASRTLQDLGDETLEAIARVRVSALLEVTDAEGSLLSGFRGVAVETGMPTSKGDWVDVVVVAPREPNGELVARTVFERVRVVDVLTLVEDKRQSVLLALLPEEAAVLQVAERERVYLVLRNRMDLIRLDSDAVWDGKTDQRAVLDKVRDARRCRLPPRNWSAFFGCHRGPPVGGCGVSSPVQRYGVDACLPRPEGGFIDTRERQESFFAVEVDITSYERFRRRIATGNSSRFVLPPSSEMRPVGFLNAFAWNYHAPAKRTFALHADGAPSPFDKKRHLLRIGLRGRDAADPEEVIARFASASMEFNPAVVKRHRLVGYEPRAPSDPDSDFGPVESGRLRAGHQATALYELELVEGAGSQRLGKVRVRWLESVGSKDAEVSMTITRRHLSPTLGAASPELRFVIGVAAAAQQLRCRPSSFGWSSERIESLLCSNTDGVRERQAFCEEWSGVWAALRGTFPQADAK